MVLWWMNRSLQLIDFMGEWSIDRRIEGLPMSGHFKGTAFFEGDRSRLRYRETGTLHLRDGGSFEAERRYLWIAEQTRIEVLFDDLRPFHEIDLTHTSPRSRHHCPPDTYDVRYQFADWPEWSSVWEVSGPKKDYRMESRYARAT